MKNYRLHVTIALCSTAILISGCSHLPFMGKDKKDYASAKPGETLEIPPDLTRPAENDRYSIPEAGSATLAADQKAQPPVPVQAEPEPIEQEGPHNAKLSGQDNDISLGVPVDRAWRLVGLALDKAGFTVQDQDRAKGLYFVTYADPALKNRDEGFLSSLEFWKDKSQAQPQKYQILVRALGNGSTVTVLDKDGFSEHTETSAKILKVLFEQLK